jgi:hypothetical protein
MNQQPQEQASADAPQEIEGQQGQEQLQSESSEAMTPSEEGKNAVGKFGDLIKKPAVGGTVAGAAALGAAAVFGVWEAAIGAGVAYVAYRVLRKRPPHNEQ